MDDYSQDKRFQYLNRNSSLPLYYQIKEHIKDAILNGEFKPNDRLPTEDELCKLYSVSRPVVRQAYDELIKESMVERRKGSGTFVKKASNKNSVFKRFISFSYEKDIRDLENESKIVKIETAVNEKINARLGLSENSETLHIIRIIVDNSYPSYMIETYLPISFFTNINKCILLSINEPIIDIVNKMYGIDVKKAFRKVGVMRISQEKMDFLHGKSEDLIFEIETKYYDVFERNVMLEYVSYISDRFEMSIEINRK